PRSARPADSAVASSSQLAHRERAARARGPSPRTIGSRQTGVPPSDACVASRAALDSVTEDHHHSAQHGLLPPPSLPGPGQPTMTDVSRLAGVSSSTVSRVLSGTHTAIPIALETRERVQRAAEALKYRPHPLARGLRGAGTALLGLIVREITDPFFTAMLNVIALEARRRGYNLVLGDARSSAQEVEALTQVLEVRHCEAIL